ncbi:putative ribonuclease H-like domain-containing protein [Tanacetum coccineum]
MTTLVLLVRKESSTRPPDNGTEFKNWDFIEFCGSKGIKREYGNVRTPQQNGVAERKNMTLIEAARTMLADSFLPNTFWAKAFSTACYVLNRNYQPVRSVNHVNKHAGPKEANHSVGLLILQQSRVKQVKNLPNILISSKKEFAQYTEDLLLQAGAAKASIPIPTIKDLTSSQPSTTNFMRTTISEIKQEQSDQKVLEPCFCSLKISEALKMKVGFGFGFVVVGDFWGCFGLKLFRELLANQDSEVLNSVDLPYGRRQLEQNRFTEIRKDKKESVKPLVKDEEASDVDVHLYRSMIGSLMYLTASRPDIMFAVCACSRVSPFAPGSLHRYDYAGSNLTGRSTTGGCQFLADTYILAMQKSNNCGYIYNRCRKVSASKLLWQNLVYHSKTKHIAYEKKLIQVLKIHTDDNVADLQPTHLMLAVSVLVVTIEMTIHKLH